MLNGSWNQKTRECSGRGCGSKGGEVGSVNHAKVIFQERGKIEGYLGQFK